MSQLIVIPDTWTGMPPADPEFEAALNENATALGQAFGIPQSMIQDAILASRVVLPRLPCLVAGI